MINKKDYILYFVLLVSSSFFGACNYEKSGHITVIDSTEYRELTQRLEEYQSDQLVADEFKRESIHSGNGVRVELNEEEFDWNTLRTTVTNGNQAEDDTLQQDQSQMAAGPWMPYGEIEYRRIYRNDNGTLWLQTQLKRNSGDVDDSRSISVLIKEEADSLGLSALWTEMESAAIDLAGSLK